MAEAAELWLQAGYGLKLESQTMQQYENHVRLHIVPLIGTYKLSELDSAAIRGFEDALQATRSAALKRKVMTSTSWHPG